MIKKYPKRSKVHASLVLDFEKEEDAGLIAKLRGNGFKVSGNWLIKEIYHESMPEVKVGYIDLYYEFPRLYISNVDNNPLEKFVEQYDSLSLGPPPRRHSRAK